MRMDVFKGLAMHFVVSTGKINLRAAFKMNLKDLI